MGFDWHKYAKIENAADLDSDGTSHVKNKAEAEYYKESQKLLEKTMDQLSTIPEFQKLLIKSGEQGPNHIHDPARLADPRLIIRIDNGIKTGYSAENHELTLSMKTLPLQSFGQPAYPFSLQHVLVHEIGHAGDEGLENLETRDLAIKKQMFQETLEATLEKYPAAREEYEHNGTILNQDPNAVLLATSQKDFKDSYSTFMEGNVGKMPLAEFDKPITDDSILSVPKMAIRSYMASVFDDKVQKEIERRDEMPIVETTNSIMTKYFKEPARTNYTVNKPDEPPGGQDDINYPAMLDSLKHHIHPSIDPKSGIPDVQKTQIEDVDVKISESGSAPKLPQNMPAPAVNGR